MADTTEEGSEAQISFKVKTTDGTHSITMAESATVEDLKKKLAGDDLEKVPVERQRLIYSGRVMKNEDTLATYKIKPNNTIHLVKSAASNRAPAASSSSAGGGASAQPAIPTNMAAGTSANNVLAGLTGARFAGHAPLPSADIFGPDGGMGPMPTEEQMADMLQDPAVTQRMNEALSNPAFVDFMIQSNPMLRDLPNAREVLQSPQFRHMMTDVESLRMAARMRRMLAPGGFPAPGATDNTPAGAPATGAAGAGQQQGQPPNPFQFPIFPAFNPQVAGTAATNPFAILFGAPQQQRQQQPASAQPTTPQQPQQGAQDGGAAPAAGANPSGPAAALFGAGPANPFGMTPEMMQNFLQMMGQGGLGGGSPFGGNPFGVPAPPPDTRPPEERYADQLRQLNDMGFYDFDRNINALRRSGGSVQGAVQHLLDS